MKNQQPRTEGKKEVIAVSKAHYRGFEIFETKDGCAFVVSGKQYNFTDLGEASACIDALYASAVSRVIQ